MHTQLLDYGVVREITNYNCKGNSIMDEEDKNATYKHWVKTKNLNRAVVPLQKCVEFTSIFNLSFSKHSMVPPYL
jgi:hypothetical protein